MTTTEHGVVLSAKRMVIGNWIQKPTAKTEPVVIDTNKYHLVSDATVRRRLRAMELRSYRHGQGVSTIHTSSSSLVS